LKAQTAFTTALETLAQYLPQALFPTGFGPYHAGRSAAAACSSNPHRADEPDTIIGQHSGTDRRSLLDPNTHGQTRENLLARGKIEDSRNGIEFSPGQHAPNLAVIGSGIDLDRHLSRVLSKGRRLKANLLVEHEGLTIQQALVIV